ncbi:hypothetical protein NDU88_007305 [Pleurodeles waltl]|uniref:Uncharacterized protein n=1 Tax=Pleurodeles waltl TaxID=8319 RepID=A0AAV7TZE7_PLEWA|nr:hypothetical protein NDU88_007305 [Pleurodeles waltl]
MYIRVTGSNIAEARAGLSEPAKADEGLKCRQGPRTTALKRTEARVGSQPNELIVREGPACCEGLLAPGRERTQPDDAESIRSTLARAQAWRRLTPQPRRCPCLP